MTYEIFIKIRLYNTSKNKTWSFIKPLEIDITLENNTFISSIIKRKEKKKKRKNLNYIRDSKKCKINL